MAPIVTKKPWGMWEYWSSLKGRKELAMDIPIYGTPKGSLQ
ncbi:hypothetical protein QUA13_05120 [Microcoleus sp. S28C3]